MPLIKAWLAGNGCSLLKSHNAEQGGILEAPNNLILKRQAEACLPADCVITSPRLSLVVSNI
jgi:hypothetical protein